MKVNTKNMRKQFKICKMSNKIRILKFKIILQKYKKQDKKVHKSALFAQKNRKLSIYKERAERFEETADDPQSDDREKSKKQWQSQLENIHRFPAGFIKPS